MKFKTLFICILLLTILSCNNNKKMETSEEKTNINPTGSTLENINNSEHTVLKFEIDNKLCYATINQYFKDFKNKKAFPFSLWVTVETKEKNSNGHPIDSESTLFNTLEDSLIEKFIPSTPFCFIGRTTRDGYREIMFYVSDKNKAIEIMDNFISENKFERKISYEIDLDETWESVGGLYR